MKVAYIRVSTAEQHEDRQMAALQSYGIDKWFSEKISGKDINRPKLQEMLNFVRDGDTVYVEDFSRLARSTKDLLAIVDLLKNKNVRLVSLKESLDTDTPTGRLMLTMIAAIAEFERQNILERQREGIELAKAKGVYKGRKRLAPSDFKSFPRLYDAYLEHKISKSKMAKELGVCRATVDRLIEEYKKKEI